jgi:NAD(P)-dependent dehydrogenase (short-subunit alcohol dehydrogenase family)
MGMTGQCMRGGQNCDLPLSAKDLSVESGRGIEGQVHQGHQSSHVGSLTLQTTPGVDLGGISGAYAPTKTYLNAVTIQYAKELSDTNVLINNACPGYVATDLNAFSGTQTPEQGAAIAIRLATLPDDGPTGGLFDDTGIVPW